MYPFASDCWLHWACRTEFELDFVLLFPLIHFKKKISKFASANFLKLSLPEQVLLRSLRPLKEPCVFGDMRESKQAAVRVSNPSDELVS